MTSAGPSKPVQKTGKKLQDTVSQSGRKSSEIIEAFIIIPPDGGWGWVVTATSFISNFTADGTMYTFGVFLDDISLSVGSTPTDVALANSLMTGFYYLSGPLIGALTNRFGYRVVSILGGLISCIAILTTSYSSTLTAVLLIYGVLGGIGFGMMYVPSIVVIGFYFERWRAIATSIAVCGSSLGIITFPILFKGLLADTEWRVKFRILSVLCLIVGICSILYRPLYPVRVVTGNNTNVSLMKDSTRLIDEDSGKLSRYRNIGYPTAANVPHDVSSISICIGSTTLQSKTPGASKSKLSIVHLRTLHENQEECIRSKCARCCMTCKRCCCCCCVHGRRRRLPTRPLYRDDIFYTGSVEILPEYTPTTQISAIRSHAANPSVEYHLSVSRATTLQDLEEEDEACMCCPISIKRALATMLDMSLLKSPSFLLLNFSGFFTLLGLYTPFLFIADRGKQHGLEDYEAYYLISTLGISNTIGRIACGIFSSLPNIKALFFSYVCLTICGVATLLSSLSYQQTWQIGFTTVFGLTIACVAALRPVILAEMLGIDKLTNAFGLCLLFQGIACLVGLPFAGLLKRLTGDYEMTFYFSGGVILVSAVMLMFVDAVVTWEKKRQRG